MNQLEWEMLLNVRNQLVAARHGEKGLIVERACEQLGVDAKTVYRKLAEAGLQTGRKARSDKGAGQYSRDHLMLLSGMLIEATRANGKQLPTIDMVVDMAFDSGQLPCKLSASRVSALLREHCLHPDQLTHQRPSTELRSLHPNHCWQIDASVCVLYYIKSGRMQSMPRDEFYKNKPHNLAKVVSDLCVRYACTDHTSGTVWARYYTGGETAENLIDFFLWCVTQREGSPAHGVPWIVMLDPGAANTSHLFKNLMERLSVDLIVNAPGNARAKGQVEQAHNLIERHFEGRLRFLPTLDLQQLNSYCERWQVAFNADKKHSRHGRTRYDAWMRIKPEQLRIAPPMQLLRDLVTTTVETRRVSNNMTISFKVKGHSVADYRVAYVPGVMVGQQLRVVVNPYRAPAIDVAYVDETGLECWMCVEPVAEDDNGFDQAAPVVGVQHRAMPNTVADEARNAIARQAHGVDTLEAAEKARKAHQRAYMGRIDGMADVDATPVPAYLPRRGTALETEKRAVASARVSVVEAAKRIRARLGDAYDVKTYTWLSGRFGEEGVPEDQIEALIQQQLRPADADLREGNADAPTLRAVGGGQ